MPVGAQGPSIIPNNGASVFPPESGMGHFNQDFPGIFPPVHRPLSLRHESQPARGLYVYEQVIVQYLHEERRRGGGDGVEAYFPFGCVVS